MASTSFQWGGAWLVLTAEQNALEVFERLLYLRIALAFRVDFSVAVDNGRMVAAAESAADFVVTRRSDLAGQIDNEAAGEHDRLAAGSAFQLRLGDILVPRDDGDDVSQHRPASG